MGTEIEYINQVKNKNKNSSIFALKNGCCRKDNKDRVYYMVPTSLRRNGKMIISDISIKKLLSNNDITQQDVDNIRPY